jgi:membrane-bound serine protease (ClpP class)
MLHAVYQTVILKSVFPVRGLIMLKQTRFLPVAITFFFCIMAVPASAAALPVALSGPSLSGDLPIFLTDPNIAYLLLAIAIFGLAVEILTPGLVIPGTIGIIAAILAFFTFIQLPVSAVGITLFILALPLFILGAYVAGAFIPLSMAGVAALLAGSITLFPGDVRLYPALITIVAIVMSAVIIFVANRVVKAQRLRIVTGREGLVCQTAVVRTPLTPQGTVLAEGEIWKALLDKGSAEPGEKVIITGIQGLKLLVTRKEGD